MGLSTHVHFILISKFDPIDSLIFWSRISPGDQVCNFQSCASLHLFFIDDHIMAWPCSIMTWNGYWPETGIFRPPFPPKCRPIWMKVGKDLLLNGIHTQGSIWFRSVYGRVPGPNVKDFVVFVIRKMSHNSSLYNGSPARCQWHIHKCLGIADLAGVKHSGSS